MKNILVVDDEKQICDLVKEFFELENDFHVIQASNGQEAYDSYLENKPDIVISDIKMPVKDGFWLLEQIKKNNNEARVILMSGFMADNPEILESYSIEAFIRKPEDICKVVEITQGVLEGKKNP